MLWIQYVRSDVIILKKSADVPADVYQSENARYQPN